MSDSSENNLCATPTPSFRRRACPVPRYGAGIQSPDPVGRRHFHLPWCRWPPAWLIATKIDHRQPTRRGGFQTRLSLPTPPPPRHSGGEPAPYPDTGQESSLQTLRAGSNPIFILVVQHHRSEGLRGYDLVGADFKPISHYQHHPYTVIPAESLPRTPIRGRNPVFRP